MQTTPPLTFPRCMHRIKARFILLLSGIAIPFAAHGQDNNKIYTPANTGFLGLNTIPNARIDNMGTVKAGSSVLNPFLHGFIGVQIATPLSITFRQSAETSNIFKSADKLLSGIDFKLRLAEETAYRPAIVIGSQSAIGHKRMAGEYIALSKRYNNFDFTAGLGWGRFGTAAHIKNPLRIFSQHFSKNRDLRGEDSNNPSDWFTGNQVGIFGGVEYFSPVKGLSLKIDYGSDRYSVERSKPDFTAPSPWGFGLSYNYKGWINADIGMQGTDKLMGRISVQTNIAKWPYHQKLYKEPDPFQKNPANEKNDISAIFEATINNDLDLNNVAIKDNTLYADLRLPEKIPAPQYIGRSARYISEYAHEDITEINLTLRKHNLRGTNITLLRKDIEKALINNSASPNEIWNNAGFSNKKAKSGQDILLKNNDERTPISFILDNQLSLSEKDVGVLYRTSALVNTQNSPFLGFLSGLSLRINMADNLDKLNNTRTPALLPVRSDIADFTDATIAIEHSYLNYSYSITPELHSSITAGYLEEFYAGFGGEILYRPINSRFALGAEIWQVFRRAPNTFLNSELNGTQVTSGQASLWYDIPNYNVTAKFSAGRFLAGDTGISLGLEKRFLGGATISASTSISNQRDTDIYGGTTQTYSMLELSLPIGSIPYIPTGSEIKTTIAPLGRNTAQSINKPISLYELTEQFTIDHLSDNWQSVIE